MSEIAIALDNVSKCYKQYDRPVDRLKELLLPGKVRANEFWALRNITLEVEKGQTLGIVGRNGSGKSTLLQMIVGTMTPTNGRISVNGRISALLELGSGFNLEFTGRQNVFFNGRLLGLSQEELEQKFDEIAAFADIGSFIDQPVKTYSSGMFVRLAFAVATSVRPDILVVDEALSVGDEAFQRKCFSRLQAIQDRGGTILFVSHSAPTVVKLCNSAILIEQGEMLLHHRPKVVVNQYQKLIYAPAHKVQGLRAEILKLNQSVESHESQQNGNESTGVSQAASDSNALSNSSTSTPEKLGEFYSPTMMPTSTVVYVSRGVTISDFQITNLSGDPVNHLISRNEYIYSYLVTFAEAAEEVQFGMLVKTITGYELGGTSFPLRAIDYVEAGATISVKFQMKCLLQAGTYFLNAGVVGSIDGEPTYLARYVDAAMFKVQPDEESCVTAIVDLLIDSNFRVLPKETSGQSKLEAPPQLVD
ncbi:MAG: ABC transporter ATP-binding protein [Scytolyngbya sp. HA4215-MV1]|nr:ABC transporter ATP-binding protein [Scytolyngbya sp. HA4215-MV1]